MGVRLSELNAIKDKVLMMSSLVEEAVASSITSLVDRDSALARKVIEGDKRINSLDIAIDEECIQAIARFQPMARDLRLITTAMKITTDLERIGDSAVSIAQRALELNEEPILKPYVDIPHMSRIARGMVKDAIDAFINQDRMLADHVIHRDQEIDDLNDAVIEELLAIMSRHPETVRRASKVTYISKHVERVGDHATNIAEMVIYLVEGKIVRHQDIQ